jgi:hypothetical protein
LDWAGCCPAGIRSAGVYFNAPKELSCLEVVTGLAAAKKPGVIGGDSIALIRPMRAAPGAAGGDARIRAGPIVALRGNSLYGIAGAILRHVAGIVELVAQPGADTVAFAILAGPVVYAGKAEPARIGQLEGAAGAELTRSAKAAGVRLPAP